VAFPRTRQKPGAENRGGSGGWREILENLAAEDFHSAAH